MHDFMNIKRTGEVYVNGNLKTKYEVELFFDTTDGLYIWFLINGNRYDCYEYNKHQIIDFIM